MYEKAIEMYEYAIKFDPKNNYSYYDYGSYHYY